MRRRLTPEEKEIRESRGISLKRFWAFPMLLLIIAIAATDTDLFIRCVDDPMELHRRNRLVAAIRMALVMPCSPYLLTGSLTQLLTFLALWLPVPFMVLNWRWTKRHKAYWDDVRAREKLRRAEKARQRKSDRVPDS
jgi:hypothetical protein